MNATKIIVVNDYECEWYFTDGRGITENIAKALDGFSSDEWRVRSATTDTKVVPAPDSTSRPEALHVTTIILDKIC